MIEGWHEFYKKFGRCCACGSKMEKSRHLNDILLDKYAAWESPAWGNILAQDSDKSQAKRALAIVCDKCVESEKKPLYAVESQGKGPTQRIIYHPISILRSADPIVEADYFKPSNARG